VALPDSGTNSGSSYKSDAISNTITNWHSFHVSHIGSDRNTIYYANFHTITCADIVAVTCANN
jgi:hypothetical protein